MESITNVSVPRSDKRTVSLTKGKREEEQCYLKENKNMWLCFRIQCITISNSRPCLPSCILLQSYNVIFTYAFIVHPFT